MSPWAFASIFVFPLVYILGLELGGFGVLALIAFIFFLTPIIDRLLGRETRLGPPPGSAINLYDLWLWLWIPVQVAAMAFTLYWAAQPGRSLVEILGASLSLGLVTGGGGINIAHEFMHRPGRAHRLASELLMSLVSYPHFCIEHVHGHHARVATPEDPACADLGVTLYAYLPRTLIGSLSSAWRIEGRRVEAGHGDRRPRMTLAVLSIFAGAWVMAGPHGLMIMAVQSAFAILILETINYIEHYGLRRKQVEPGRYERVRPEHSWNSPHRLTSAYLLNLPRHSDHHAHAARPYWELRHFDDVPQLPAGYPTMILVAMIPPLWKAVMDPKAQRWNQQGSAELNPPSSALRSA